jgi:predicted small lipoprotein YifL
MARALLLAVLVLGVTACGQKGPLYFRDNPPPGYKPPKADPYKPVPYPKTSPDADGEATDKN